MRCFNPRPCTRGDSESIETLVYYALFQSTPLYEGRLALLGADIPEVKFQSTPLYEGRPPSASTPSRPYLFQSTPLYEGRRGESNRPQHFKRFQSTPLYEGRRQTGSSSVSTHGFNPRPCTRGDLGGSETAGYSMAFQSTPLYEGRHGKRAYIRCPAEVSIHAPVRGATLASGLMSATASGFNPRPCTRGDVIGDVTVSGGTSFQSTPLYEGRRRPHSSARRNRPVSIHAPVRGATPTTRDG